MEISAGRLWICEWSCSQEICPFRALKSITTLSETDRNPSALRFHLDYRLIQCHRIGTIGYTDTRACPLGAPIRNSLVYGLPHLSRKAILHCASLIDSEFDPLLWKWHWLFFGKNFEQHFESFPLRRFLLHDFVVLLAVSIFKLVIIASNCDAPLNCNIPILGYGDEFPCS